MDKAVVFIDGGYLSRVLKDEYGETAIDFMALSEKLCGIALRAVDKDGKLSMGLCLSMALTS